ncbi:hypothetical protein ACFLWR_04725 [Chloroflexota bacterium]
MNPHDLVDEQQYWRLHLFLKTQFQSQLSDIRGILRLPYARIKEGGNLAAASLLFNFIGGMSVCLYNASYDNFILENPRGSGPKFKKVLDEHYPWPTEVLDKDVIIDILYRSLRNPLTHALGLYQPDETRRSRIVKSRLTPKQIAEIENSDTKPSWLPPTVILSQSGFFKYDINIPSLYWGIFRLLCNLLKDRIQLEKSEEFQIHLLDDYNIKGLKSTVETMGHMDIHSEEYQMLAEGIRYQLSGLKNHENILTPQQKQAIESINNALGI